MSTQRDHAIEIYVELIRDVSPREWDARLEQAAGGDDALRRRVGDLLYAHARTASLPDGSARASGATFTLQAESPGSVIGPYTLRERIGEGGMGTVYIAEQAEPVRRTVALKVIKAGTESRPVVARFEAERQALALMDHPHIARVLDAGATDCGRPYFVMELVDGIPITDFCDRGRLTVRERLELFVLVCHAVQHAHQKGVIHRDLKPSNILVSLVDGAAVPKVIDFGVAKATGAPLTDQTACTGFHQLLGTPLYMSPEQADLSGIDIDTRCDVYALGILLYELLTGMTPFDERTLRDASFDELRRIIREQEPPRPSARLLAAADLGAIADRRGVEPKRLVGLVRGDLDWIAMKCLEKERERRYATVNGLASDVRRALADEPVVAGPPSAWYRLRKFARRNRTALATAGLVAVGPVFMAAWVVRERDEARRQWHLAEALLGEARRVLDEERAWLNAPGFSTPELRRQREAILNDLLASNERFVRLRPDDPGLAAGKAMTLLQIGTIRETIGPVSGAVAAYRAALDILEGLVEANPGQQQLTLELARGYNRLGACLTYIGKLPDAERAYRRARGLWDRMPGQGRTGAEVRDGRAETLNGLAQVQVIAGNPARSEQLRRATASLRRDREASAPASPSTPEELASDYADRGASYRALGMPRPALDLFSRALELAPVSDDDPDPGRRCWYAACLRAYGVLHHEIGSMEAAGTSLRRSVAICRTLVDDDPANIRYRDGLGRTMIDLGRWQRDAGDAEGADRSFCDAIEQLSGLVGDGPGPAAHRIWLALGHANRGMLFLMQDRSPEAGACYEQAIEVLLRALEESPRDHQICNELALLYANCPVERLRDPEEAVRLARANVRDDPGAGAYLFTLGMALYRTGRPEAIREASAALDRAAELFADSRPRGLFFRSMINARLGDRGRASELYARGRSWMEENDSRSIELIRLRDEAARALGTDPSAR